jgi:hypothetical protein
MPFADELVGGLELTGFEVTIDRHSIVEGEDWKARIGALIAGADTIVFILSPESVQSSICIWEVEEAQRRAKRILPVLCRPIPVDSAPPALAALNYVRFDDGRSFVAGLSSLVRALNTDVDWLREHTRLLSRAMEWDAAGRQANRMLAGADIDTAKKWAAHRPKDAPEPTNLHLEFIKSSEQAEAERASVERIRLVEMQTAQAARAEALADRELAVSKLSRRTMIGLISSGSLTITAAGLAYWGLDAENRFRKEREKANQAEQESKHAAITKEAMRSDIEGQFVAYATSPGQMGAEGIPGQNSPYTKALLIELADPSLSLYEACFKAHFNVRCTSRIGQRPFLSTDMNGDIYLQRQPSARRRKAIVISVDRLEKSGQLYNVENDAVAWSAFLKNKCGFDVVRIKNPTGDEFGKALEAAAPPSRLDGKNCLSMFVFAGFGAYYRGENYLMTEDSDANRIEALPSTMIALSVVQDAMRKSAASAIILDTNFPDLDNLQTR